MEDVRGEFQDVMVVSELRGGFPDVAIASDVDYAGLIAGDDAPFFVTLPIGKANVTSGNKRYYDEAWLTELERQTVTNKPVGLMGHLSAADRGHAMPVEAIHWVGALREGDTLWGKGYVPVGEARTRIQRYRASNTKIATSIDAFAEGKWDDAISAFRMDARTLRLGQIDIAPADRAGISALAAVPHVTSEMATTITEQPQEPIMDKYEVIREMTLDDAKLLPETVRQAIVATVPAPPQVAMVQELCTVLGVDENALKTTITEMQTKQVAQAKAAVKSRITELAADPEKGIKLESVRGLVVELVEARQPATVQDAEAAYQQVIEMQAVKAALATNVQTTMGPRQRTSVQPQHGNDKKYFEIPTGEAK